MTRKSVLLVASALFASSLVTAQMQAPKQVKHQRKVSDPQMLIQDRNTQLEVLPTYRAAARAQGGRTDHALVHATAQEPFTKTRLGVVFNHTLHAYGLLTGEIGFKLKSESTIDSLDKWQLPGLTQLVAPDIYVVKAETPTQFVTTYKWLSANAALEWVEPYVLYGSSAK